MTDETLKKDLGNGRWAEISAMTFDKYRIIVTDGFSVFESW